MERLLLAILVGIPLVWHLGLTGVAYYDAGRVGLEPPKKWAALTFFVPVIGFFIYLFERSELSYDPETDPYRGNNVNIHRRGPMTPRCRLAVTTGSRRTTSRTTATTLGAGSDRTQRFASGR